MSNEEKEKEFHNGRIAFYIKNGYEHEIVDIPRGMTHKEALGWRYDSVEKYNVRGYLKDRVLMLYQGADFGKPKEEVDYEKLFRHLDITKGSLDYIGLGCKVGEIGEQWEPLEKIELGPDFKYISYMITVGGDAGWRFSNKEEWCSSESYILFDSSKWTMEQIANEMKACWNYYWHNPKGTGFTLSETFDNGIGGIQSLVEKDGVFLMEGYGCLGVEDESKFINPSVNEIEIWNMNGSTHNYGYNKK